MESGTARLWNIVSGRIPAGKVPVGKQSFGRHLGCGGIKNAENKTITRIQKNRGKRKLFCTFSGSQGGSMERILIVDDDVHIGNMLEEVLRREGYAVSRAYSGTEALLVLEGAKPDLVLLDLMLPGLSGEEVLFRFSELAVIVVSARADVDSKVGLLTSGAVDYVTKPFDVRELLARIKIALREKTVSRLSVGDLRLDTATKSVFCNDIKIHLTRTEYAILKILMQNCTGVVAKHILLEIGRAHV